MCRNLSSITVTLLQEGCPVAFSSRVMSQIEKELLAKVFDQCIFGRSDVVVESDLRPLETIFKKPILTSPKRLQRMRLRLQNYNIQVVYKTGIIMFSADTLSRAYLEDEPERTTPRNDVRSIKE